MRIRLLVDRRVAGGVFNAGDRLDVEDAEAVSMIEAGEAEPVRHAPVERAVPARRAEKAIKP